MISNRLSLEAERIAARYELFTDALASLYHNALNSSHFGTSRLSAEVAIEAGAIARRFMDDMIQALVPVFMEIAQEARRASIAEIASNAADEFADEALEHLGAIEQHCFSEIYTQTRRDVETLTQALRRVALEVSVSARSRGVETRRALIEHRIANKANLTFTFTDRTSRKWSSAKFVRTATRQALLAAYNETVMLTLAEHGLTRARVVHQDGAAAGVNDMVIALTSSTVHPTYSEIREQVFHPNANAWLAMEAADV